MVLRKGLFLRLQEDPTTSGGISDNKAGEPHP